MLHLASTTIVETWSGTDLAQVGPIYPFVGWEFVLWILGLAFWIGFHVFGARVEKSELEHDNRYAHEPERLNRVFSEERDV